jgi:antitoxin component YwqK of YwqJK toxin-antitoxin module
VQPPLDPNGGECWMEGMKKLLAAMFVALLMVGCGGEPSKPSDGVDLTDTAPKNDAIESAVDLPKLQDRSGVTYLPNTDKPFSGYAKRAYENEQVEVLAEFKDGYVVRLKQWQENGIPRWDIGFGQGKVRVSDVPMDRVRDPYGMDPDGLWASWHENGQKEMVVNWKDGKVDGLLVGWYENGQKEAEINWKDGKRDGLLTEWYENGQKKKEINFKDGEEDGLSMSWFKNGQKKEESTNKDGKLWTAVKWKPNGEKCPVTNIVNGNGVWVYYNEGNVSVDDEFDLEWNGTESERLIYKDGKIQ